MVGKIKAVLWGGSYNSLCKGLGYINEGNVEVVAIADNDSSKKMMGRGFGELYITPDELHTLDYDYIVVSTTYAKAVIKQLELMGIGMDKIILLPRNYASMDYVLSNYAELDKKMDLYNRVLKWHHIGEWSYSLQWMANRAIILHKYYDREKQCFDFKGVCFPYEAYEAYPSSVILEVFDILPAFFAEGEFCETCEGPYEYGQVKLEKGDTVIDCGANVGMFSAMSAVKTEGGKIYSFEPIPQVIEILRKTSSYYPNIVLEPYAVSNSCGEVCFEVDQSNVAASHIAANGKGGIPVQKITLDEFVKQEKITKVDFIKADIEGAEPDMLLGAVGVLKEHAPKLAICTYHNPNHPLLLESIIKNANPDYVVEHRWKKLFAYVPK